MKAKLGSWPHLSPLDFEVSEIQETILRISVIIPVHQAEKTVRACVESIICGLTDTDEIILVENGSTDSSIEICRNLMDKYTCVTLLVSDVADAAAARNIGVGSSRGDVLMFCDADDTWRSDKVRVVKYLFDTHKVDFLFHPMTTTASIEGISFNEKSLPVNNLMLSDLVIYGSFIVTSSVAMSRSSIVQPVFQDGLTHCQDYEAWCHWSLKNKNAQICYIDEALGYYEKDNGLSRQIDKRLANHFAIALRYCYQVGNNAVKIKALLRNAIRLLYLAAKNKRLALVYAVITKKYQLHKVR